MVHPLRYARYATHTTANYLIFMGWTCSIIMSTAPLYWNKWEESQKNLKSGQKICELYTVLQPGYVTFVLTPAFASVWVAMLLLYCRIWREARGHAIRMRNTPSQPSNVNDKKSIQVRNFAFLLSLAVFSHINPFVTGHLVGFGNCTVCAGTQPGIMLFRWCHLLVYMKLD